MDNPAHPQSASVKAGDSVTRTTTAIDVSGGKFGLNVNNSSGSATFNIGNLNLAPNDNFAKYFWLEMDVDLLKENFSVAVTLTPTGANVIESAFWTEGTAVTGLTGTENTYTWDFGDGNGEIKRANAWFKLDQFASAEALKFDFVTPTSSGAHALIDNLHIATNPEPVAAALFGLGGAMMALRRRFQKKVGLQLA